VNGKSATVDETWNFSMISAYAGIYTDDPKVLDKWSDCRSDL
jgi:hypothetical protein